MRVDKIEVRNFGSHRHTVLEPGPARFVVVVGPNGIGKTTLASEALGHALFKDDRGTINAGVRVGATDSAVLVEFDFNGTAYRAIRRRTTRGAGTSSADLQRRDPGGHWIPVASGDREVPAAVAELLRMDGATFRTSVSLAQKDLDRFVAARASGRKEVLAAIVVDPRFAPAAELAGRRTRELEAQTVVRRERIVRLEDSIAELERVPAILARQQAELATAVASIETARAAAAAATGEIRELDVALAQAETIAGEISRLTVDLEAAEADWRATARRRGVADANRILAENTVAGAADVDAAIAALPAVRGELDQLVAGEAVDRQLAAAIATAQAGLDAVDRPFADTLTTWKTRRQAILDRIGRLEAQASGAATCEACGQPIGAAAAREQLARIRAERDALGEEPRAPLAIARASAALSRLESRRRELGWDPEALIATRARVDELTAKAARGETISQARTTVAREERAIAEATEELEGIRIRGTTIKARLEALAEQQAASDRLREQRELRGHALRAAELALEAAEAARRDAERRIAASEVNVARLEELTAERDAIAGGLAASELATARLRKLAAAFGLKGIPARIIEGVLPELSRHANEVLEQLFGMSLEIRAQREKADGKGVVEALDLIVRKDDVGELELERISGGQQTAVSLALAVGLSRLNARRAGTAIRTFIVDEPDGLDVTRLRALGAALRTLAWQGELERIFLITHTAELAEFGDLVVELREGPDGVETYVAGERVEPAADAPVELVA